MAKFTIRGVLHAVGQDGFTTSLHMADHADPDRAGEWLTAHVATGSPERLAAADIKFAALLRLRELLDRELARLRLEQPSAQLLDLREGDVRH